MRTFENNDNPETFDSESLLNSGEDVMFGEILESEVQVHKSEGRNSKETG